MLLDGRSAEKIAAAFNLSPKTVSNYHYAIKLEHSGVTG
jgi:two-component system, NarL family, invasion response regulator UvrY